MKCDNKYVSDAKFGPFILNYVANIIRAKSSVQFKYKEAMTVKEAAQEFYAYLMDKGELPEKFIVPIGKPILEYQK